MNTDKINEVKEDIKSTELYKKFCRALNITTEMRIEPNPFVVDCIKIAEEHATIYAQRQSADSVSKGETVFVKRYLSKGELPKEEGEYLTSQGWADYYKDAGFDSFCVEGKIEWWLEEVSQPQTESKPVGRDMKGSIKTWDDFWQNIGFCPFTNSHKKYVEKNFNPPTRTSQNP